MNSEAKMSIDEQHDHIEVAFIHAIETYREKIWALAVDAVAEDVTPYTWFTDGEQARVELHIGLANYDVEGITKDFGEYLSDEVDQLIHEVINEAQENEVIEWGKALLAFSKKLEELSVRINKALREAEA